MSEREICPHCKADLRGEEIPVENREKYYGGATHFLRVIGVEIRGVYDGTLFWRCPDCGGAWHRWPKGSQMHSRAKPFVSNANLRLATAKKGSA